MVVFTCNNCGESLQKPKVAKHYQFQCRTSENLTCVDCHKDFYGQEYVTHTKCITESERYGGQDYVARPGQNKGERKQQEWINVVKNVIDTSKNLTNEERNVLNILSRHENIPRKKAKFLNFIRSVMGNRFNMSVIDSIWNKMETAFKEAVEHNKPQNQPTNGKIKDEEKEKSMPSNPIESQENNIAENQNNENISRENGNTTENGTEITKNEDQKKKKSKKRDLIESKTPSEDAPPRKKNKKKHIEEKIENETTPTIVPEVATVEETTSQDENRVITKFDWKAVILEIVGSNEISLKKLRKKVVNRYMNYCSTSIAFEKAALRFDKKFAKMTEVTINDDKVKLS